MCRWAAVNTKADFVRRYKAGEFGNHAPTWNYPTELEAADYKGKVHLRSRVAGGVGHYNLSVQEALKRWWANGSREWYCSGMAPHEHNLVQGELLVDGGWFFTFSDVVGKPMREALAIGTKSVQDIIAISMIKHFMCPNSWDWLQVLLERYPGHVIEFTIFNTYWGTLPRYNTVFWEIRNY